MFPQSTQAASRDVILQIAAICDSPLSQDARSSTVLAGSGPNHPLQRTGAPVRPRRVEGSRGAPAAELRRSGRRGIAGEAVLQKPRGH